ncbi:SRPBCC family protein [Streptomyces sp. CB01881]|uniref:SRPBCC family protein n=1 Tax=Streptomyces sp. CB01881 TaxID=2078691 RepID=UPI000CDC3C25|nr:SRPBCC family protein [Streptomyces sp. CB01881]AUY48281.1 carbon monoxide dehydrogenase [Streptomyces sp. CB01881]TYC76771.1 carbon monoxide dehydrogenase [Streptomyces sp. CB01881]
MEFTNEFHVSLPVEAAWDLFTDVERIAPCMPGAQLTGVDGERFHGTVKVRVGAVTVQYRGTAAFDERDEANHTVRLTASGRDTHGQGNADAHVTARLAPDGDGTRVTVETRLSITGKVAQFGKGVMTDISRKLLDQFTACLEERLAAEHERGGGAAPATQPAAAEPAAAASAAGRSAPVGEPRATSAEGEPLDLLAVARGPVAKRLASILLAGLILLGVARRLRRACRRPRGGHRA